MKSSLNLRVLIEVSFNPIVGLVEHNHQYTTDRNDPAFMGRTSSLSMFLFPWRIEGFYYPNRHGYAEALKVPIYVVHHLGRGPPLGPAHRGILYRLGFLQTFGSFGITE
jgi:hypothetical protein